MRFFSYVYVGICLPFTGYPCAYAQNTTEQTVSSFFQSLNPITTGAISPKASTYLPNNGLLLCKQLVSSLLLTRQKLTGASQMSLLTKDF